MQSPVSDPEAPAESSIRERAWRVIFLSDTPAGRAFDVVLLVAISLSVLAVMVETVPELAARHMAALRVVEWGFTGLFTLELIARLAVVRRPHRYLISFFGDRKINRPARDRDPTLGQTDPMPRDPPHARAITPASEDPRVPPIAP